MNTTKNKFHLLIPLIFMLSLNVGVFAQVSPLTQGLVFNGTSQYMVIENHADFNVNTNESYSISCWVKTDLTRNQRIIGKRLTNSTNTGYGVALINNRPFTDARWYPAPNTINSVLDNHSTTPPYVYTSGSWIHLTAVFDMVARKHTLYVNGALYRSMDIDASVGNLENESNVYVGGWAGNKDNPTAISDYWSGNISELRFWKKAMTQSEAAADMTAVVTETTPDLVAAYDFKKIALSKGDIVVRDIKKKHSGILRGFGQSVVTVEYEWLAAPAIAVKDNVAKVVGPGAENFTQITIDGVSGTDLSGIESGKKVKIEAKDDNDNVIRLVITK